MYAGEIVETARRRGAVRAPRAIPIRAACWPRSRCRARRRRARGSAPSRARCRCSSATCAAAPSATAAASPRQGAPSRSNRARSRPSLALRAGAAAGGGGMTALIEARGVSRNFAVGRGVLARSAWSVRSSTSIFQCSAAMCWASSAIRLRQVDACQDAAGAACARQRHNSRRRRRHRDARSPRARPPIQPVFQDPIRRSTRASRWPRS